MSRVKQTRQALFVEIEPLLRVLMALPVMAMRTTGVCKLTKSGHGPVAVQAALMLASKSLLNPQRANFNGAVTAE